MELKQEFIQGVKKHLGSLDAVFDSELEQVIKKIYPDTVRFFLFEYDSPVFSEEFSVSIWPTDIKGHVVGDGHWFLEGKAVVVPPEIYEAEKYSEIEPWETASELLEEWLIAKWAGISKVQRTRPAYIGHHDSFFKRELLSGKQVNWDEILERVNG
ncbi:uncharacterized protein sS8_2469 [Methylocaldum marinum]|uniref:Uncharacterized protein n=1 Tax=Methylocaldum marinum TaxID=1432792 RepID=A0A250KTZ2_9GAMM|nr:hypothetical protein [Methylocaldum marinum]BBA34421.1 uncharacterized protein sS8_2469 [Methylocaldum marinum]